MWWVVLVGLYTFLTRLLNMWNAFMTPITPAWPGVLIGQISAFNRCCYEKWLRLCPKILCNILGWVDQEVLCEGSYIAHYTCIIYRLWLYKQFFSLGQNLCEYFRKRPFFHNLKRILISIVSGWRWNLIRHYTKIYSVHCKPPYYL